MATARKAPAKRAASQPPMAAKRAGARAPAVHKAGAKRAAPNGAANGAAHQPGLRAAAGKPARAKVDGERAVDALPREAAAVAAEPAARKARVSEAAVPVQLSDAETVARPPYWDKACADLVKRDRILKKLIPKFGPAHLVKRGDSFVTLARSVVGPADLGGRRAVGLGQDRDRVPEARAAADHQARPGKTDRVRAVETQIRIYSRSRPAFRVGRASRRQMGVDGRRGRDRRAHADPRDRPLDSGDVPDLQFVTAGRAAARRSGAHSRDQRQLFQRRARHAQRGARSGGELGAVADGRHLVHVAQSRSADR
ncbi:base excision DNA repair protein, HhH-GPD family [Burkholderia mallei GB8 horse 4]|nr:base excision DNA repair protein, HhH-GPD family [Burkholderia mallei GB8 horse 4]